MKRPRIGGRWIRWKYVLPRVIVAALVVVTFRFALDPTLHWAIVASSESALGAKVDLGGVSTDLRNGVVVWEELAATNPKKPMKNLLEAKSGRLELDLNELLRKRLVVTGGEIAGIEFDTARTVSGALETTPEEASEGPSIWDPLASAAQTQGAAWLDGVGGRLESDILDQLQSPRLAKELEGRWPTQYRELEARVDALRTQAKTIENEFRQIKVNPLRNLNRLEQLQADLAKADNDLRTLTQEIHRLPGQVEQDRNAVAAARAHDEALLRDKLQFDQIDGEELSYYLLGDEAESNLATVVGWLRYARQFMPSNQPPVEPDERGVWINFERNPRPTWLVQRLSLTGAARLAGQTMYLEGTLADASSHPRLHPEPTELRLQAVGQSHAEAIVRVDRRGDAAIDTLHLEWPDLQIDGRTLGSPDKLALTLPASPAALTADVEIVDEQLRGTIVFAQPQVRLQPAVGCVKDARLADAVTAALARVDGFRVDVALTGTLERPDWKIDSNLGPQLATGMNGAVKAYLAQRRDLLLAKAQQEVDQRMAQLTSQREAAQQKLLASLGDNQKLLGALAPLASGDVNAGGFSLPRLGRALTEGVLK
ncbi:MAG: TIGR03545 family protein [Planctomycetales bacterium]|nr:TIGR03545 family protein [Planctomycetales bacterium]